MCGGDPAHCQDPANQRAFEADFTRCYISRAVGQAMRARENDPDARALVARTIYHPERVKP